MRNVLFFTPKWGPKTMENYSEDCSVFKLGGKKIKLVRHAQMVQSVIDSSGAIVRQVFTAALITPGLCSSW